MPFVADMVIADAYNPFVLHASVTSAIKDEDIVEEPSMRIYPNPFEENLSIDYSLFETTRVRISVFDTFGNTVRILVDQRQEPGVYQIRWDADLPSAGAYFIRLDAGRKQKTMKVIRVRSN